MTTRSNIASIGRFSSQMLTYLGTQRTVRSVSGTTANTFKWAQGPVTFPSPGSVSQSDLGGGVVGNYSSNTYNNVVCYFQSRGASELYSQTMTALAIDMASMLGVSPQKLLEDADDNGKLFFTPDAYRAFNLLRDPGNQVATVTSVNNKFSLQARQIRS